MARQSAHVGSQSTVDHFAATKLPWDLIVAILDIYIIPMVPRRTGSVVNLTLVSISVRSLVISRLYTRIGLSEEAALRLLVRTLAQPSGTSLVSLIKAVRLYFSSWSDEMVVMGRRLYCLCPHALWEAPSTIFEPSRTVLQRWRLAPQPALSVVVRRREAITNDISQLARTATHLHLTGHTVVTSVNLTIPRIVEALSDGSSVTHLALDIDYQFHDAAEYWTGWLGQLVQPSGARQLQRVLLRLEPQGWRRLHDPAQLEKLRDSLRVLQDPRIVMLPFEPWVQDSWWRDGDPNGNDGHTWERNADGFRHLWMKGVPVWSNSVHETVPALESPLNRL